MPFEGGDVVGEVELLRLAQLCRDIADVQADRCRRANRIDDLGQQQARHDARIEAAGADDDQFSLGDGAGGVLARSDAFGRQPDPVDCRAASDLRLADDLTAIEQSGVERHRCACSRHDLTSHREDTVHLPDRFLEVVALDRGHRREQQVADRVPAQASRLVAGETVLEQLRHDRFRVGQRRDAVADVTYSRNAEFLSQSSRRTAVVGDRHHGGDIAGVLLEPAKQSRETGAAAENHDARPAGKKALLIDDLDERLLVRVGGKEWPHENPHHAP